MHCQRLKAMFEKKVAFWRLIWDCREKQALSVKGQSKSVVLRSNHQRVTKYQVMLNINSHAIRKPSIYFEHSASSFKLTRKSFTGSSATMHFSTN